MAHDGAPSGSDIDYYLEVRTSDGRLVTTYTDKTLLKYEPEGTA